MTWSIHRTIIEHPDAQSEIDAAEALYPRFGEAWDALKWLLARRADVLGYHKTVGRLVFRIYKQAGDILAQTPAIVVVYTYTPDQVVVYGMRATVMVEDEEAAP